MPPPQPITQTPDIRYLGKLGVTVVAEGIETRAELDAVRSLGIDLVQGYLLARPAFEALPTLLPERVAPPLARRG